jgi:hypothetical protein
MGVGIAGSDGVTRATAASTAGLGDRAAAAAATAAAAAAGLVGAGEESEAMRTLNALCRDADGKTVVSVSTDGQLLTDPTASRRSALESTGELRSAFRRHYPT